MSAAAAAFARACVLGEATTVRGALRPYVNASVISGLTMAAGDVACQRLHPSPPSASGGGWARGLARLNVDGDRVARFGAVGATLHAPYVRAPRRPPPIAGPRWHWP